MSSCFLCDTSYKMVDNDRYNIVYAEGQSEKHYMKYMPIMIGSTGIGKDDQQHTNDKTQNYVSYRVKKIEFRLDFNNYDTPTVESNIPNYIVLFKVPFREPIFDYYFTLLKEFILFSEPECILKYCVCPRYYRQLVIRRQRIPNTYCLVVDKPFIVGPNDYVGVFYLFYDKVRISSSAKVWFDVV